MKHQLLVSKSALVIVIAVAWLAPLGVAGQAPSSPNTAKTKVWTPPRTAWGEPDLQGVWDFRTATPLERPRDLAGKEVLTDAEAAEFEAGAAVRNDRDRNVPAGNVGDYNQFWYDRGTNIIESKRSSLVVDPPDGRIPAFTPEAQKREDARTRAEMRSDNPEDRPLRERCLMGFNAGPPMTPNAYNNNVQLVQAPEYVVILNEMVHDARIIPMGGRPHGTLRRWMGDSRGRWEGNTLVVDTINFLSTTATQTFRGSSPNLHLVERFTRVDANTLLYEFTVDDPTTWVRPWSAAIPMRNSGDSIYEYACHEANYGLEGILKGARFEEKATEDAATKSR